MHGFAEMRAPGNGVSFRRLFPQPNESDVPPALPLLGNDALNAYGAVLDAQRAEMKQRRDLGAGTAFRHRYTVNYCPCQDESGRFRS